MSKSERLAWNSTLEGFGSLQQIFEQAMIDAEEVDETEVSYMAFKEKYDKYLYFPMYKEDMGFYMPVADQEKAATVNSIGFVVIGNEVKCLRNIANYADLQATGQAYYDLDEIVSLRAAVTTVDSHNTDAFIGQEIDSGWFYDSDGDRKIRFKIGRKSNKQNINPVPPSTPPLRFKMNLKLEISFRKKTWLGWLNYSSATDTNMTFIINGTTHPYHHAEEGSSSHDWTCPDILPWETTGNIFNGIRDVFSTPAINATFNTQFRAFDGTPVIIWSCTLPAATFVET